jgi:PKD repeat protein
MAQDSPHPYVPPRSPRMRIVLATLIAVAALAPAVTAWGAAGPPRFITYASPTGTGDGAGEPSVGSNWQNETVFFNSNGGIPNGGTANFFGGFLPYMLNVVFNDCQSPAVVSWNKKNLLTANTPRVYGDPILYVDRATGRTFVAQEEGITPAGSTTDITTNDGNSFTPSQGSGPPSCIDHETIGGGPFHAPLPPGTVYPNAIYYCSQCVGDAVCALSLDGGMTYLPSVPTFGINDCVGLHGHIKIAPNSGTAYIPNKGCGGALPFHEGGKQGVIVSTDNGVTWDVRTVATSSSNGLSQPWDPSVAIGSQGTAYFGYAAASGAQASGPARVAVSTDEGLNWIRDQDVGASLGIKKCVFPAMVAGDDDRAALVFYGTTTDGDDTAPGFPGVWYLYIASTFDRGQTWTIVNATPGDPVQRGGICKSGDCRNMLDFMDATVDKQGRILAGWDDGCVGNCVTGPPNSFSAKSTITRQSGGKRMYAINDPVEPRAPEAPGVSGTLIAGVVQLTWMAPDNGGAAVTAYNVYRKIGVGGAYSLRGNVAVTNFSESVDPTLEIYYKVAAVNSQGEGATCGEYRVGAFTRHPCVLPGLQAVNDVASNGTDLDSGQNIPPDPSVNVKELSMAEPYAGEGVKQVTFTLQMAPGGVLTPSSQWYIVWARRAVAADGSDRRYVAMKTDVSNNITFTYGNFGPPIPLDGSVPPTNANTPTQIGVADFGSHDLASGVITIKLATSKVDDTPLVAGNIISDINVRTYLSRPDAGQKSQNNAADITDNGSYTLVGNASCFCFVDQPPIARLTAAPTEGNVPLTVNFNASTSSDPDPGDEVLSYTFSFGDGSDPVTQASPTISHQYTSPSGANPYIATLTVKDKKCSLQSVNIASVLITARSGVGVTPQLPSRLRIAPATNPSHGQVAFQLELDRDGQVSVQVLTVDGRRVAEVMNAWMPAGRHALNWRAMGKAGSHLPAGVYMVRAKSGDRVAFTRVILMR